MKKVIAIIIALTIMGASSLNVSAGTKSDYQLAKEWAKNHGEGYTIKKVITISKGGRIGKVKGTKWIVRYPKKVKKGKKVTVYMVEKDNEVYAMVCLGKIK